MHEGERVRGDHELVEHAVPEGGARGVRYGVYGVYGVFGVYGVQGV